MPLRCGGPAEYGPQAIASIYRVRISVVWRFARAKFPEIGIALIALVVIAGSGGTRVIAYLLEPKSPRNQTINCCAIGGVDLC